jgi:type II secretion system protein I
MNARGFTLLEVLVALSILGIAVVASMQGFAQGLRLLKLSGDHQEAMLIADQRVREVLAPEEGREEGSERQFLWTRTIAKVAMPDDPGVARPTPWTVYHIDVRVRWDERREVQLMTLRTLADTPPITPGVPRTPAIPGVPQTPRPGAPQQPRVPGALR